MITWGLLAAVLQVTSTACFDYASTTGPVGRITLPGPTAGEQIDQNGTHLFVGDTGALQIYVIGDDTGTPVGTVNVPAGARYVDVSGTRAYVSGAGGFSIVDVSDPGAPVLHGSLPGIQGLIRVDGSTAYVALGAGGLRILDVNDPDSPSQIGSIPGEPAWGVDVAGGHAYVSSSTLRVYDVSVPASPGLLTTVSLPDGQQGYVKIVGSCAYVACAEPDLAQPFYYGSTYVYDVSAPAAPVLVTAVGVPAYRIAAGGGLMVTTGVFDTITVIDVSDPMAPAVLSEVTFNGSATCSDLTGDGRAFVTRATQVDPAQIVELSLSSVPGPAAPSASGYGSFVDAVQHGSLLFAVARGGFLSGDLHVFDASGATPSPIGNEYLSSMNPISIAADGQWAVISGRTDLSEDYFENVVIDVSVPTNPQVSWTDVGFSTPLLGTGGAVATPFYYGHFGYAGSSRIFEITSGGELIQRATLPVVTRRHLVASGMLYCATDSGLRIYDVTDPDLPVLVGSAGTMDLTDAFLQGDVLYAVGEGSFFVFDVADPSTPELVGSTPSYHEATSVVAAAGFAYLRGRGFEVIDVSNPTSPASLGIGGAGRWGTYGSYTLLGGAGEALHVFESVAPEDAFDSGDGRVCSYPLQCASSVGVVEPVAAGFRLAAPFPNPFREQTSFRLAGDLRGPVDLAVFDVAGRRVRTLLGGNAPGSPVRISWDGRDGVGDRTAAGVYFVRLRSPQGSETRTVVRLR